MTKKINFDKSLGEFVAQYPQVRDLIESYDLDYCCGGKKNIEVAAKEKNIDLDEFESLIQIIIDKTADTEKTKDWTNESLVDIVDHIQKTHHEFTWKILASSKSVLNKLVHVHGEKHGDFLAQLEIIFENFKIKLEKHLKLEEDVVFDYVRKFDKSLNISGDELIKNSDCTIELLELLQKEHEETAERLAEIKSFTSNYELPDYACASFAKLYSDLETLEDDLHLHINLENSLLFPRLEKILE